MFSTQAGTVAEIICRRPGMVELWVETGGKREKAVLYPELTGDIAPGDPVLLNTTAVRLGLGSGGYHFVQCIIGRESPENIGSGHIMKLRYTPWQIRCKSIEEPGSAGHDALKDGGVLDGMPVVVGELHSQLAPVAAMVRHLSGPAAKVVYIMTDGAALPIAFSNTVHQLREKGLINATITYGHAFGGDAEAVNVYSALLAAKRVYEADTAIVVMGPGIVGTGTKYGFTGIEQAPVLDAVAALGGDPIAVTRMSFSDARERHRGVSHHTLTVLGDAVRSRVTVPVPSLDAERAFVVYEQLATAGVFDRHQVVEVDARITGSVLGRSGLSVTTMGRGYDDEMEFFMAAGAAGIAAARSLNGR